MKWLPVLDDFSGSLKQALAESELAVRRDKLIELTGFRLDYVDTIRLDHALSQAHCNEVKELQKVRLAVLSSCTVEHLFPALRVAGFRHGLNIEIYNGAYGQYRQEVLNPASALYAFDPDVILFSVAFKDAINDVPVSATADETDEIIREAVSELEEIWRIATEQSSAIVIQQSFLDVTEPLFGNHDRLIPGSPARMIDRLNEQLLDRISAEHVMLLDLARASARDGIDQWFDIARWLQAKIEVAPTSAPVFGELLARLIGARYGHSRKCLVLDLDDTLWGGVIGDDGLDGIVLGEGSALGEAHLRLQKYVKSLSERGVILAVCSHNDPAVVEQALEEHPDMLLERTDFAVFAVNWDDKAENLIRIAETLNIGLDSLVFVDDNPMQRARIRESLPMVAVPELPGDPAGFVRTIGESGYFEALDYTVEDLERSGRYAVDIKRKKLQESAQTLEDFLSGLDMSVEYGPVTERHLPRVTQLVNKTNQFNTTTLRYSQDQLREIAANEANMSLQFRLSDRLGDSGLVSVMTARPDADDAEVLRIVNWVMSCRVFGRQLEEEVMNIAVETALSNGIRAFHADFVPTEKNIVIRDLFAKLGFSPVNGTAADEDVSCWSLTLADYAQRQTHFSRKACVA